MTFATLKSMADSRSAPNAETESLMKRGLIRTGQGYDDTEGGDFWEAAAGSGIFASGDFPVAIIKIKQGE
jgi:hypothetical protein